MSGIKKLHTHQQEIKVGESSYIDTKTCYVVSDPRYREIGLYMMKFGIYGGKGEQFIVAYNTYSWHWHAFNEETGQEIATFTKEFYEKNIRPFKIGDLEPDPNCVG